MEQAWQASLDGDGEALNIILMHCHQLSGSAALYGHAQLGESALQLHSLLKSGGDFVTIRDGWMGLKSQMQRIFQGSNSS